MSQIPIDDPTFRKMRVAMRGRAWPSARYSRSRFGLARSYAAPANIDELVAQIHAKVEEFRAAITALASTFAAQVQSLATDFANSIKALVDSFIHPPAVP